jgi:hypothetical protein
MVPIHDPAPAFPVLELTPKSHELLVISLTFAMNPCGLIAKVLADGFLSVNHEVAALEVTSLPHTSPQKRPVVMANPHRKHEIAIFSGFLQARVFSEPTGRSGLREAVGASRLEPGRSARRV